VYICIWFFSVFKKLQALNLILLTSSELSEIRVLLKQSLVNPAGKDLFVSLYASWCHSPMAIISLCFLAQVCIYNLVLIATRKIRSCPTRWVGFVLTISLNFIFSCKCAWNDILTHVLLEQCLFVFVY
jgi:hypothetical protein